MKKLYRTRRFVVLGITGAALMSAGLVQAQPSASPSASLRARTQTRIGDFINTLGQGTRDLRLSPAQKTQLKQSARKHFPEARAIWGDSTLTPSQKVGRIKALASGPTQVLTPAQRLKAADLKDEAIAGVFSQMRWVSDELDLTGEQENKIRKIVLDSFRKSTDIPVQNKNGKPNYTVIRALVLNTQHQINAVLTPEQRGKWRVIQTAAQDELVKRAKAWRENA